MKIAFGRFLHARSTAVKLMVFRGGLVTPFHLGQPNRPPLAKKGLGAALGRLQTKQVGIKKKGRKEEIPKDQASDSEESVTNRRV